jgi:hypothetical protein
MSVTMGSGANNRALLVDDGELHDVRDLLSQMAIPYAEAESFESPDSPTRVPLLITNTRHALAWEGVRPSAVTHLVVYNEVSRTLRKVIERSGCDLVLQRPINPDAFRLLAEHALYEGPERRRSRRVVVSTPVKLQVGRRGNAVTLVQLSLRGCGFTVRREVPVGTEVKVTLPREFTGGDSVTVRGPVLATRPAKSGGGMFEVAMAFRLMDVASRRLVNQAMQRQGGGKELRPRATPPRDRSAAEEGNRRAGPRKRYVRRVLAAGAGISHVLIGRDLSTGGMRVRRDPDLEIGDLLRLAVHGRPGLPPIMVKAVVSRDDGEDGIVLRFHEVPQSLSDRLGQIVDSLPTLPTGKRAGSRARPGVVVTEVVDDDEVEAEA